MSQRTVARAQLTISPRTTFRGRQPDFAGTPAELRASGDREVRLLVARPEGIRHQQFSDLAEELNPGDALVVNTSATVPGEIDGLWLSHRGPVDVVFHAATQLRHREWVVELRSAPDAAAPILDAEPGQRIQLASRVAVQLVAPYPDRGSPTGAGNRLWRAHVRGNLRRLLNRRGRPIAYGYLAQRWPLSTYQTVFSQHPGSAEMASAARPFTAELVQRLRQRGVRIAPILLHTGVSSQEAGEPPQPEWFEVPERTARLLNQVRADAGRVVAVGTTATRAVESAARAGRVRAQRGWTERIVTTAPPPEIVDGLVTGWHDAGASHLLLVEAVAGAELTQQAYDAALGSGYVWHEFGDSALFLPGRGGRSGGVGRTRGVGRT